MSIRQQFNQDEEEIVSRIKGLLVDMDGVVHVGPEPVPGLSDFLNFTRRHGIAVLYVTNNSSLTTEALLERLRNFGVETQAEAVMNSATATTAHLTTQYPEGARVYVVGELGLRETLKANGFQLTEDAPQVVVVGVDHQLNYEKIRSASRAILNGAAFLACNADSGYPTPEGLNPGAGAAVAAIQAVTGVTPFVVGKPEPTMFLEGVRRLGLEPGECAAVGDRLDIDILTAERAGLTRILVLSGMTSEEMIADSPIQPDLLYRDIGELAVRWEAILGSGSGESGQSA
jgi:4-nitrophenyl phosphatase